MLLILFYSTYIQPIATYETELGLTFFIFIFFRLYMLCFYFYSLLYFCFGVLRLVEYLIWDDLLV